MRLLVVGGTRFLGRHIVECALGAGHGVTVFHRGRSGPDLFEGRVRRILGDRDESLAALKDKDFDSIIDTCAYFPRHVRSLVKAFAGRVPQSYVLVSSVSVYKDPQRDADDSAPVHTEGDPEAAEVTGVNYGFLKGQNETAPRDAWGDAVRVVQPGAHRRPPRPIRPLHILGAEGVARRPGVGARRPGPAGARSSTPATWPMGSSAL